MKRFLSGSNMHFTFLIMGFVESLHNFKLEIILKFEIQVKFDIKLDNQSCKRISIHMDCVHQNRI